MVRMLGWTASLSTQPAKVGVEGSNPFARSKILDENQKC